MNKDKFLNYIILIHRSACQKFLYWMESKFTSDFPLIPCPIHVTSRWPQMVTAVTLTRKWHLNFVTLWFFELNEKGRLSHWVSCTLFGHFESRDALFVTQCRRSTNVGERKAHLIADRKQMNLKGRAQPVFSLSLDGSHGLRWRSRCKWIMTPL